MIGGPIGWPIGGIIPVQINGTATATLDDVTLTATGALGLRGRSLPSFTLPVGAP